MEPEKEIELIFKNNILAQNLPREETSSDAIFHKL